MRTLAAFQGDQRAAEERLPLAQQVPGMPVGVAAASGGLGQLAAVVDVLQQAHALRVEAAAIGLVKAPARLDLDADHMSSASYLLRRNCMLAWLHVIFMTCK